MPAIGRGALSRPANESATRDPGERPPGSSAHHFDGERGGIRSLWSWYLPPGPGKSASQRIIRSLFAVHPDLVETDYEGAFISLGPRLRKRSLVVLFLAIEALVHIEPNHFGPGDPRPFIAAAAAEALSWRDKLIRDLKRSGALVLDVLPRELSPGLINRYLEVKARHML